jgi:hypothetical protein
MFSNSSFLNFKFLGYILVLFSSILFLFGEIINDRFWLADFEVYYKAAERIINSENLYRIEKDGYYIFKYSPTSAIFFIPFLIFSFSIAKYIYWFFITLTIILSFKLCIKLNKYYNSINITFTNQNLILIPAIFILAIHYLRELHLGQVNQLLCLIFILMSYFFINNNKLGFSSCLAISIFIKPFTLIFIPYLIFKKKYKELLFFILFTFILFLLPFIFYKSFDTTIHQYKLWINELQIELSNKQSLNQNANHTVFSVLSRMTPIGYFLNLNYNFFKLIYQIVVLLIIGIAYLFFFTSNSNNLKFNKINIVYDFGLLISTIPLIAFTSENAFIFTQLLVFILLSQFKNLLKHEKLIACLAFIFIGGDFKELIGDKISDFLNHHSFISIGTILLIILLFRLRFRQKKEIKPDYH